MRGRGRDKENGGRRDVEREREGVGGSEREREIGTQRQTDRENRIKHRDKDISQRGTQFNVKY